MRLQFVRLVNFAETRLRIRQIISSYILRVRSKVELQRFVVLVVFFLYQGLTVMYLDPRVFVNLFRIFFRALETVSVEDDLVYHDKTCVGVVIFRCILALNITHALF